MSSPHNDHSLPTQFSLSRFVYLFEKEGRELFSQFTAYVVIAVFFAIVAYSFTTVLFFQRSVSLVHAISQAANLLILIVPILTMRQISQERESGTLALLFSVGCTELEIMLAKFCALVAIVFILVGLCVLFPIVLAVLGKPDFGLLASSFVGLSLFALSLVALGLCVATFFTNPIIAAFVSFGLFVALWTIDIASYMLPPVLQSVAAHLSLDLHLSRFLIGAIYLSDLSYFILLILASLIIGTARLNVR